MLLYFNDVYRFTSSFARLFKALNTYNYTVRLWYTLVFVLSGIPPLSLFFLKLNFLIYFSFFPHIFILGLVFVLFFLNMLFYVYTLKYRLTSSMQLTTFTVRVQDSRASFYTGPFRGRSSTSIEYSAVFIMVLFILLSFISIFFFSDFILIVLNASF